MKAKNVVFITGASRGFGQALALQFVKDVFPLWSTKKKKSENGNNVDLNLNLDLNLDLVLVARSSLSDTVKKIRSVVSDDESQLLLKIIALENMDLGNISALEENSKKIFNSVAYDNNDNVVIKKSLFFHNAGSLGELVFTPKLTSLQAISSNIDLNVTSFLYLTGQYLQWCHSHRSHHHHHHHHHHGVLINISSLCAILPTPSMSLYCAGKAYRDMATSVVAAEEDKEKEKEPSSNNNNDVIIKTINYAPGPMKTDMAVKIKGTSENDKLRHSFRDMFENDKFVDMHHSASTLMKLLNENTFKSGSHIDYFDAIKE